MKACAEDMELREYQSQAVSEVIHTLSRGKSCCLWIPTGGGKTEVSVALAKYEAERGGHTLFVVDRKNLASQSRDRFQKYGMLTGVMRGEDTIVRGYEPVTVASIQTLASRLEHETTDQVLGRTSLVIIDEAHIHHQAHDKILEKTGCAVVGLSATPMREGMGLIYDELIKGPSYKDLIEMGYLVKPRYFIPARPEIASLSDVKISQGDFDTAQLSQYMRQKTIMGDVISHYQKHGQDRPAICFGVDIAHAKALAEDFNLAGVPAAVIHQGTPDDERAEIFSSFKQGDLRVLSSVAVLSIGFDEPSVSCVILARPTLSTALKIQQEGRGLRPYPGKQDCLVFDHALNVLRHGRIEDYSPVELDDVDKDTGKKKRSEKAMEGRACPVCTGLIPAGEHECPECGYLMARRSQVDYIDAELMEEGTKEPVRTNQQQDFYAQMLWVCRERGWKSGVAYYKTKAKFPGFEPPKGWMKLPPKPPTPETTRWLKSEYIRWRKGMEAAEKRGQRYGG